MKHLAQIPLYASLALMRMSASLLGASVFLLLVSKWLKNENLTRKS